MATGSLLPKNIIVRMPNWLGDLVMATPILADLRHHFTDAKITAMCQSNIAPLLMEDPHIDELISFKKPSGWLHREAHKDIIEPLKQGQYDCGILLTNSLSSAWWFWRGDVKNRIGYATHCRSWLLDIPVREPKEIKTQHLVITYKMLLEPLHIPISAIPPSLYLTRQEKQNTSEWLKRYGVSPEHIVVGINPGAAYGSAKCWLPERYKEMAEKLLQNPNVVVLFFGDKTGKPLVDEICKDMNERVINLAGKTTIRELMALIDACSVFLTNDSGPMHMASALGTPLLALFGSTSDKTTGPYRGGRVIHKHVACSPCYRRECPIDFRCMTSISVNEVYDQLQEMIEKNKP